MLQERVLRSKQPWFGSLPPDEQFVYDRQLRKIDDMKVIDMPQQESMP
jgi:hypothetical protein